jgi:hypothetical protein
MSYMYRGLVRTCTCCPSPKASDRSLTARHHEVCVDFDNTPNSVTSLLLTMTFTTLPSLLHLCLILRKYMPFCYARSCFKHQATFVAHNASFEYLRYVNLPVTSDSCSPSLSYLLAAASSDLVSPVRPSTVGSSRWRLSYLCAVAEDSRVTAQDGRHFFLERCSDNLFPRPMTEYYTS